MDQAKLEASIAKYNFMTGLDDYPRDENGFMHLRWSAEKTDSRLDSLTTDISSLEAKLKKFKEEKAEKEKYKKSDDYKESKKSLSKKKAKKKKESLLAMVLFIAISCFVFSQATENNFESNSSYFNTEGTAEDSVSDYKAPSTTGFIVKTIVVLVLVVAAIYGIMLFFKKKNNVSKSDDDFLRRVSSLQLSPGRSIEIVSLIDKAYILGVTDSNINLISEVEDKELIEAMNLNFDKKQNVKKPMNFSDVLEIFMPHGPRNNTNIYEEAERKVSEINSSEEKNEE